MNIRVVAGRFGGRKLDAPGSDNRRTKPMGERIRNAVFNSIAGIIDDAAVLDAFAGTGAIGIEALSRGAKHVTFVEKDRIAQKILSGNIASLNADSDTDLVRTSVTNWLETSSAYVQFDIIFADPPYHDPQPGVIASLAPRLKLGGRLILSWPKRLPAPNIAGLDLADSRVYSEASVNIYIKHE